MEAAEADIAARASAPAGRIVVAAFPAAAVAFAHAVTRELGAYPDLTLVMRQARTADCSLGQLPSGEVDIAVVDEWTGRPPARDFDTLTHLHLQRGPLVLAVPPTHRLADPAEPIDPATLRNEPWIAAPPEEPSRQALNRYLGGLPDRAGPPRRMPWEFEDLATIVGLVARGAGIAMIPRIALTHGRDDVAVRELPAPTPALDVYAAARTAGLRSPAITATLAALRVAAASIRNDA